MTGYLWPQNMKRFFETQFNFNLGKPELEDM